MKSKNKAIKIAVGSVSALGAIGGAAAGIVLATKTKDEKKANANEILNTTRGGQQMIKSNKILLDLEDPNLIEVGIPKFAEDALNALMEKVFTARAKGIYQALSNDALNKDKILDEVSKTAFEDIYNINLDIKSKSGEISISLGDLLLEFLNNEDPTKTPLAKALFDGNYMSLASPIAISFDKSNSTIGSSIGGELMLRLSESIDNGGLDKLSSALSGILPSGLSISLGDNLILTGLVDKIQDRIIKDFDKISEMQGKTFAEIADNPIYRRVATAIFGMKYSGKILEKDVPADALEALKIVYKATNNQEISKEEFISAFSNQGLLSFLEQKEGVKIFDLVSTINLNGKSASELLGNLIGSYVDINYLNIPELQWGRGAGQLGANEQKLATKISELLAYKGSGLADLFGYKEKTQAEIDALNSAWGKKYLALIRAKNSGMDKESDEYKSLLANRDEAKAELDAAINNTNAHKGLVSIFSIIGLYTMPQVNGVYTTPSLNNEETTNLVTKLYNNYFASTQENIEHLKEENNNKNITELTADKLFQDTDKFLQTTIFPVLIKAFGSSFKF